MDSARKLQSLLGFEVLLFLVPSFMHRDWLIPDHQHAQAATAETVIALVLLVGLLGTMMRPRAAFPIGLGVQIFALLGTLVGATMIAIGVGPRSGLDFVIHAVMLVTLVYGIVSCRRWMQRRT